MEAFLFGMFLGVVYAVFFTRVLNAEARKGEEGHGKRGN